jgi:hypothetical protein
MLTGFGGLLIKNLISALCFLLTLITVGSFPSNALGNNKGLANTFAKMLEKSISASDYAAHVEIIKYWTGKRSQNKTLYHIKARELENFKGPSLETVEFSQWIMENSKGEAMANENITGDKVIVALEVYGPNHAYRVPEGSSSFPDHNNLLDVARVCCDEAIAKDLVILFKSARSVFVQNKPLIKNPTGAGIDAGQFITLALANYKKATGTEFRFNKGNVTPQEMLISAMKSVVHDVVTGKDTDLNPKGYLLPAIFGRKAGVRFGEISNGKLYLKVTTRDTYIMHSANKADEWEKGIIGGKFLSKDWEKGKPHSDIVKDGY